MPTVRYFIVHDALQDAWFIRYGQENFGPYKTHDEAKLFAVDAAEKLGETGESAEICLMGDDGHFHTEWLSGRDDRRAPA